MIKRILSIILALVVFGCLYGCDQDNRVEDEPTETITDTDETEPNLIEQAESDYIISTDWMTFYFSKGDFKERPPLPFYYNPNIILPNSNIAVLTPLIAGVIIVPAIPVIHININII